MAAGLPAGQAAGPAAAETGADGTGVCAVAARKDSAPRGTALVLSEVTVHYDVVRD